MTLALIFVSDQTHFEISLCFDLGDLFASTQISKMKKLSSVFICQFLIGLVCSESAISDWIKKLTNGNVNAQTRQWRQPTMETTTEQSCTPYDLQCPMLFVTAIDPSVLKNYGDVAGRYHHAYAISVEWAPDRPVYVRFSDSRNSRPDR